MRRRQHRALAFAEADLGRSAGLDLVGDSRLLQARARRQGRAGRVRAALCRHVRRRRSTAARRGSSRTPTAAATTARRTNPDSFARSARPSRADSSRPSSRQRSSRISGRSCASTRQGIAEYLSLSSQLVKSQPSPAIATVLRRINYISEWLVEEPLRPAFGAGFVRRSGRSCMVWAGRRKQAKPMSFKNCGRPCCSPGKRGTGSRGAARSEASCRPPPFGRLAASLEHRRGDIAACRHRGRHRAV